MALRPPLVIHATIKYGVHHFAKKKKVRKKAKASKESFNTMGSFFNTKVSRFLYICIEENLKKRKEEMQRVIEKCFLSSSFESAAVFQHTVILNE